MNNLRLIALALAVSIFSVHLTPVRAQLQNGGFELPAIQEGTLQNLSRAELPSWTITTWNVNVLNLPVSSLIGYEAFEGQQVLDLNGTGFGTIVQDFRTTPGTTYRVRFAYADTPYVSGIKYGIVQIENPLADDIVLSKGISHSTSTTTFADWSLFDSKFAATGSVMRLRIALQPSLPGGLVLDAVSVSAIPEPPCITLVGALLLLTSSSRRWIRG